jgi:hypothetical protein
MGKLSKIIARPVKVIALGDDNPGPGGIKPKMTLHRRR